MGRQKVVLITWRSFHRAKAYYDLFSPVKNLPLDKINCNPNSQVSRKALMVQASVNMDFCVSWSLKHSESAESVSNNLLIFYVYEHTSVIWVSTFGWIYDDSPSAGAPGLFFFFFLFLQIRPLRFQEVIGDCSININRAESARGITQHAVMWLAEFCCLIRLMENSLHRFIYGNRLNLTPSRLCFKGSRKNFKFIRDFFVFHYHISVTFSLLLSNWFLPWGTWEDSSCFEILGSTDKLLEFRLFKGAFL